MQRSIFKQTMVKAIAFKMLLLTIFAVNASAGLDTYSIYLNNKLVLKQSVLEPLNVKGLNLHKASASYELVIYYSQCNMPDKIGKGRSIAVKDDKGMRISVKELLELEKRSSGTLVLVYSASQLLKGQKLAGFHFG